MGLDLLFGVTLLISIVAITDRLTSRSRSNTAGDHRLVNLGGNAARAVALEASCAFAQHQFFLGFDGWPIRSDEAGDLIVLTSRTISRQVMSSV